MYCLVVNAVVQCVYGKQSKTRKLGYHINARVYLVYCLVVNAVVQCVCSVYTVSMTRMLGYHINARVY